MLWVFSLAQKQPTGDRHNLIRSPTMQQNIGNIDKAIRVIVGLVLISLVFVGPQTVWGWIGVPVILIALVGMCPLYKILGLSTCKQCKAEA